jgi:hypothetical protein
MSALQNVVSKNDRCKQCRQPLEQWEAGFCEGCGMSVLTRQEADALCRYLEIVTENGWWSTQRDAHKGLFDLEQVLKAWKKVEATAGLSGMVPDAGDFYK